MDCVAVCRGGRIDVLEFRNVRRGDPVILGRTEDASEGIYVYPHGFSAGRQDSEELFAFRRRRSRETAFSGRSGRSTSTASTSPNLR